MSATKRDAKQYLARFKSPIETKVQKSSKGFQEALQEREEKHRQEQWQLQRTGVNLGGLYEPTRAIADSPTFIQQVKEQQAIEQTAEVLHVALVGIRNPQDLDDEVVSGFALTLAQLVRLDMQIVIALNCGEGLTVPPEQQGASLKKLYAEQGARIVAAIEKHNNAGARYVDSALSVADSENGGAGRTIVQGGAKVEIPKLIVEPLKRGAIPVIPALAYTSTFRAVPVAAADVMLALTRTLSGIDFEAAKTLQSPIAAKDVPSHATSLDRIILLDLLGGLPTVTREDKAHVFVNLQQEYEDIQQEYQSYLSQKSDNTSASGALSQSAAEQHLRNLDLLNQCLALLPPATSALVITPEEAAGSSQTSNGTSIGISTRRQKNPLIHNLLTNKPTISSSLPVARLSSRNSSQSPASTATATGSTVIKRGMPLAIVPDPRKTPWRPPQPGQPTISLENNPDINFPRLLALIEDSFRRPLDVQHYLNRIRNRVAGVIIAGEYEGGAILTWEAPPSSLDPANPSSHDPSRLVPYLDKFAVLQRSQGSSGVADIVFQAMVRSCFPQGVCWRSRQDNPVNKWYFERARGTWKLQESMWTMFWTTDGLVRDEGRWRDYVEVCRSVKPSWKDGKRPD